MLEPTAAAQAEVCPIRFQAPVRDEESESQRKARSRMMRQSRRSTQVRPVPVPWIPGGWGERGKRDGGVLLLLCWQGVTLTDLKEAEKTVAKGAEPPPRSIQAVSPIVALTPAERGKRGRAVAVPPSRVGFAVTDTAASVVPVGRSAPKNNKQAEAAERQRQKKAF